MKPVELELVIRTRNFNGRDWAILGNLIFCGHVSHGKE